MNQTLDNDALPAPLVRSVKISEIDPDGVTTLSADDEERAAIKALLDLVGLEQLDFTYRIRLGKSGRVHVSGELTAKLVQNCVVTLEAVPAVLDVPVEIEFWPPTMLADLEKRVEDPQQAGLIDWPEAIDGDSINLGPVVYETLATSLDPYPRKEGARFDWSEGGTIDEEPENGPFAGLKRLKKS